MQNLRYLLARSRTLVSPHACEHSQALFPSSRHVKYSAFGARVFYVQKRLRLMASKDLQQLALEVLSKFCQLKTARLSALLNFQIL